MARQLVLGTAGHIDHGKTALVKALTGIDTDRLEEEKRRGISIDIGFAHLDLGERRVGIVDVPGHERFIRNMLAGASGIDVAMLVVAADDSVMPQTREHMAILELLQVRHGVIVLTKADLADSAWRELVEQDIRALVRGTFLEDAPIIATSVVDGRGLDELKAALAALCARAEPRSAADLFRMAVDRSFVLAGLGTVVTGTVSAGIVRAGEELEWFPPDRVVRVRSIQSHGRAVESVERGQRAALNLMGAHHDQIMRGHVLAARGFLRSTRRLTAELRVLPESPWPLRHRARVRLHAGTQEVMAQVRLIGAAAIPAGGRGFAQLACAEPVACWGRQPIVIRSESPLRTIGGGLVLQTAPTRPGRRDQHIAQRLERLRAGDDLERAAMVALLSGTTALSPMDLCRELDIPQGEAGQLLDRLVRDGTVQVLPIGHGRTIAVHRETLDEVRERVVGALRQLHRETPLQARVPRERLARRLADVEGGLLAALVDRMRASGAIGGDDTGLTLAEFKPQMTEAQRGLHQRLLAAFESGGFSPPDPLELAKATRVNEEQCRLILQICVSDGTLVHLEGSLYLHGAWERKLRELVRGRLGNGAGLSVAEIRDLLGTSRKYAVPFCEHLDRVGVTRREGDLRVLKG